MRRALSVVTVLFIVACGQQQKVSTDGPPAPAHTSLSPDPAPFLGSLTVTLTTDKPATIYVTDDGSDPTADAPTRRSGDSTLTLPLGKTTTLKYFSVTPEGAQEPVSSATFVRAGPPKGTITGVVVVDTLAVGKALALQANTTQVSLGTPAAKGEVPFTLENQADGAHRLFALSDRDGNGQLIPFLDLSSDVVTVTLDSTDPFKASAEGIKLYVGASQPGQGTIRGTITFPRPPSGQSLSVAAVSSSSFSASADPQALLSQLQNGDQIITNSTDSTYDYAITNLDPGSYVPVAVLTGFGIGGVSMNFQGNPLTAINLAANQVATHDFSFGGVGLSGSATFTPATAPTGAVYGLVAAKKYSLGAGLEAVFMPTFFTASGTAGAYVGAYGGTNLRESSTYSLRAFDSTTSQNPLTDALSWVVAFLNGAPAQATVTTQTTDVVKDFSY